MKKFSNIRIEYDPSSGADKSVLSVTYSTAEGRKFMTYSEYFELMAKIGGCLCVEYEKRVDISSIGTQTGLEKVKI